MAYHPLSYPAIPQDTLQTAESLYGHGNIYLKIGNQWGEITQQAILSNAEKSIRGNRPIETMIQAGLLIAFQYAEELPNRQMVEALRKRVDIKYALHLPLNFPDMDPARLCDNRRDFFVNPARQNFLQALINRLVEIGLFARCDALPMSARGVLDAVCTINRFDEVVETTYQTLETLAITDPNWLRQIALPSWYDRYSRKSRLPSYSNLPEKWNFKVLEIGGDIQYLLREIEQAQRLKLSNLPEVHQLRRVWREQFELCSHPMEIGPVVRWRLTRCASCNLFGIS